MIINDQSKYKSFSKASVKKGNIYRILGTGVLLYCVSFRGRLHMVRLDNSQTFSLSGYENTDQFMLVEHELIIKD